MKTNNGAISQIFPQLHAFNTDDVEIIKHADYVETVSGFWIIIVGACGKNGACEQKDVHYCTAHIINICKKKEVAIGCL